MNCEMYEVNETNLFVWSETDFYNAHLPIYVHNIISTMLTSEKKNQKISVDFSQHNQ
jgi:hypothetical protein